MKNIIRKYFILFSLIISCVFTVNAQDIPQPTGKYKYVQDFAGILSPSQKKSLEESLSLFTTSTSSSIVVVTVNDLNGDDISSYATELSHQWGIGEKGKDNGIVLLVKPKTKNSKGEVNISVGYGLEGAVPDVTANLIIQREIIPLFKKGRIYDGIYAATNTLKNLVKGEYSPAEYKKKSNDGKSNLIGSIIIVFIIIAAMLYQVLMKKCLYLSSRGITSKSPIIAAMQNQIKKNKQRKNAYENFNNSSGNFSSPNDAVTGMIIGGILGSMLGGGRGGFGGDGGGFGGGSPFGGGGFGGGGASGSW